MTVKRWYRGKLGDPCPADEGMAWADDGPFVLASDYDALAARVRLMLDADARGVVMSSNKDGVWNHMQELKKLVGWKSPDTPEAKP